MPIHSPKDDSIIILDESEHNISELFDDNEILNIRTKDKTIA